MENCEHLVMEESGSETSTDGEVFICLSCGRRLIFDPSDNCKDGLAEDYLIP